MPGLPAKNLVSSVYLHGTPMISTKCWELAKTLCEMAPPLKNPDNIHSLITYTFCCFICTVVFVTIVTVLKVHTHEVIIVICRRKS